MTPADNIDSPAAWRAPDGALWLIATAKATDKLQRYREGAVRPPKRHRGDRRPAVDRGARQSPRAGAEPAGLHPAGDVRCGRPAQAVRPVGRPPGRWLQRLRHRLLGQRRGCAGA
ncbi:hypothetical protein G6F50_017361 [Rhizopus delemar]|uniref:Uncharacterized protein n=1 Tax=Rhizopus delemar TaxID=936053 RepID=A0A9P6XQE9_9FUNG|nr:hypothetical protein G6F50_017361 [Rhizopus delemar]